jgi:hypothetical protein
MSGLSVPYATRRTGWIRWFLPSLADLVFIGLLLATAVYGPRMLNTDGDLGRHLTIGRHILATGAVPTRDLWSHTRLGSELVPHEWLAEVLFALADGLAGLDGVVWLTGVVIAATFWGQARWLLGRGYNAYLVLVLVLWAAGAASLHWLTRPHVFTYPFALAFAWQLDSWRLQAERGETPRRALWRLPLLFAFWANLHGAYIVGLVLVGLHGAAAVWAWLRGAGAPAARWLRDLALTFGLCLAAGLLNPAGAGLLLNSVGYLGNRYLVDRTIEYRSPDFHQVATWPFAGLVLLTVLLAGRARRGSLHSGAGLLVLLAWLAFGLYAQRNIPLFALVGVPVLVELADGALREPAGAGRRWAARLVAAGERAGRVDRSLAGGLWAGLAALAFAGLLVAGRSGDPAPAPAQATYRFSSRVFPVAAADYLAANPPAGRMFNEFIWGGYLLNRLWPGQLVFIDGQTDFYGEALTREYAQVSDLAPGWEDVLARYRVDWIIVPVASPLGRWLAAGRAPAWQTLWRDDTAVIFRRSR